MLLGCAEPKEPPVSTASMIEDTALLDTVLAECTVGDEKIRASQNCKNARRAVDAVAAREEEEKQEVDLEAESERKRAALRRRQDTRDQQQQAVEDLAEISAAEKEAEELTGSADYADELLPDEPEVLPPTTPMGAVMESEKTGEAPLPGLRQTDVCSIDPSALTDADLETLLSALRDEWQYRQSQLDPEGATGGGQLPADEQRVDDPAKVFSDGDGG